MLAWQLRRNPLRDLDRPYLQFVREERQFCAVLAHLLMQRGPNLRTLLDLTRERLEEPQRARLPELSDEAIDQAQVYVEFAILRDLWSQIDADLKLPLATRNEQKRAFICDLFRNVEALAAFANLLPLATRPAFFNEQFMGQTGRRVASDIASPALWRVDALWTWAQGLPGGGDAPDVFRCLCMLAWTFRIKPDLVIWLPGPTWLCIEAKLLSPEGQYPTGRRRRSCSTRPSGAVRGASGSSSFKSSCSRRC